MAVTVDTVVLVIGTLQVCSSQPARPYMATLNVGLVKHRGRSGNCIMCPPMSPRPPGSSPQPVPTPCLQGAPNLTLALMPAFQVVDQKLSGQRAALERGQNPLPLYLSLSVKENSLQTLDFKGTILSPIQCVLQYTHTCS